MRQVVCRCVISDHRVDFDLNEHAQRNESCDKQRRVCGCYCCKEIVVRVDGSSPVGVRCQKYSRAHHAVNAPAKFFNRLQCDPEGVVGLLVDIRRDRGAIGSSRRSPADTNQCAVANGARVPANLFEAAAVNYLAHAEHLSLSTGADDS